MTATEELRRMLDERGVEWWQKKRHTCWKVGKGQEVEMWRAWEAPDGSITLKVDYIYHLTPEQAIAATLGSSNCTNGERTNGTCRLDGYTDAMFRVCQAPEDTDFIDYAEVCECSACGASVIVPHEYERVTAGSDELWPNFNYCPNCGAKVVEPTTNYVDAEAHDG